MTVTLGHMSKIGLNIFNQLEPQTTFPFQPWVDKPQTSPLIQEASSIHELKKREMKCNIYWLNVINNTYEHSPNNT